MKINEDTVRVYNVHLQSIRMKREDYQFAEDISKIKNINKSEEINKNTLRILHRLKYAFIKRAPQAEMLEENIRECRHPLIVCGDFNDTPASYTYHVITSKLIDAFTEMGVGMGKTYQGVFPSYRIDYLLHSQDIKTLNFRTLKVAFSDHYPIVAEMMMSELN